MHPNSTDAATALLRVHNGDTVFIHTAVAAPQTLVQALAERKNELKGVRIYHLHTEGPAAYALPDAQNAFEVNALFIGANVRKQVQEGGVQFVPIFLSEIPFLFRRGAIPVDVALIQVSAPDKHGFCSLGVSVDATKAAVDMAKTIIAEVNPRMPRTHGDGLIHMSRIHAMVPVHYELHEHLLPEPDEVEQRIGAHIAELIEDGSTLQMGIGTIPNAVLSCLHHHKNLGIHTEMFSDGVIPLVESGVINGSQKRIHPGKIVSGFLMGSRELYDFVDDNPQVAMLDIAYVNDTAVIRRNPKQVSINSAIEVDLTGQVCADSIGTRFYSGVGGQMDFIRGASLSEGGKPIIALPSTTSRGESKIVPILKSGAGVVTTRAHVHYVVTEYGAVDLWGKNIRQRIEALVSIAHPNHRETLLRQAAEYYHV
ncbi:4-hydroxybutyrate CoA-transferase [bacterium]|nr:4-hydroxybutyrate CoA-transferase [bacterium]